MKKSKISLITILLALICAVSMSMGVITVFARDVSIQGSTYFYTNNGATVRAYHEITDAATNDYTTFRFTDNDDNVVYKYNLAYNWYAAVGETYNNNTSDKEDGTIECDDYTQKAEGWFKLVIGFSDVGFNRYAIKFQSQQFVKTKDGVTTNYIVFVTTDGGVKVLITDNVDDVRDMPADEIQGDVLETANAKRISIAFRAYNEGEYTVDVSDGTNTVTGALVNVGGTFAKRVNSTKAGVMPLTFSADFGENEENTSCEMVLYSMNNQSFKLDGAVLSADGTYYEKGKVEDTTPPVLCINENISYLEYGEEPNFEYTVIDVLSASPKATVKYYVLTGELYNKGVSENFNYENTAAPEDGEEALFNRTLDDDDLLIEGSDNFLPQSIVDANKKANAEYNVGCLAKVYLELTDVTSSTYNNAKTNVFLDWYCSDPVEINGHNFIKVATDKRGATYNDNIDTLIEEYQEKIDNLAIDGDGNFSLSAGSESNFYLPAYTGFISDNADGYQDLKYSIYYSANGEKSSSTSLAYNNLSIPLKSAGQYKFTIYATDRAGNNMYYMDNGEVKTFEASEIYDDEIRELLPWFTFDVVYDGASIEAPGEQSTGYVGKSYSDIEFEINGISKYYETEYSLYLFDREGYNEKVVANGGKAITYTEFVKKAEELFTDPQYRTYFKTITPSSSLNEADENYDEMSAYNWNETSVSFVPQDENSFYMVRLVVTNIKPNSDKLTSYMAIPVSAKAYTYKGDTEWLKNNVASIVLFSISGVCLIGIAVLFLVKPKEEKADIDEQLAIENKNNAQ